MLEFNYQVTYEKLSIAIENEIEKGTKKFVIYPYGRIGKFAQKMLGEKYGIDVEYVIDNRLFNGIDVLNLEQAKVKDNSETKFLICSDSEECYFEVRNAIYNVFSREKIVDVFEKDSKKQASEDDIKKKINELDKLVCKLEKLCI